jgi:hypothetical protein
MPAIYEYVKDKHGHLRGVMYATSRKNIGWSFCNSKKGDKFDKELGIEIASGRAKKRNAYRDAAIPNFAKSALKKMKNRAKKYFKEE